MKELTKDYAMDMSEVVQIAEIELGQRNAFVLELLEEGDYAQAISDIEEMQIIQKGKIAVMENHAPEEMISFFIRAGLPSEGTEPKDNDEAYELVVRYLIDALGDWDYEVDGSSE